MRRYECHDGKPGLSSVDAEHLKKTNPKLFRDTVDKYGHKKREGKVFRDYSISRFMMGFNNAGMINLQFALQPLFGPSEQKDQSWGVTRALNSGLDPTHFGSISFYSNNEFNQEAFSKMIKSIISAFKKKGIALTQKDLKTTTKDISKKNPSFKFVNKIYFPKKSCEEKLPNS